MAAGTAVKTVAAQIGTTTAEAMPGEKASEAASNVKQDQADLDPVPHESCNGDRRGHQGGIGARPGLGSGRNTAWSVDGRDTS